MEFQCQTFQKCKSLETSWRCASIVVTDKEAPKAALDSAVKQIKGNIEANHNKKNKGEIRASNMRGTNSLHVGRKRKEHANIYGTSKWVKPFKA